MRYIVQFCCRRRKGLPAVPAASILTKDSSRCWRRLALAGSPACLAGCAGLAGGARGGGGAAAPPFPLPFRGMRAPNGGTVGSAAECGAARGMPGRGKKSGERAAFQYCVALQCAAVDSFPGPRQAGRGRGGPPPRRPRRTRPDPGRVQRLVGLSDLPLAGLADFFASASALALPVR